MTAIHLEPDVSRYIRPIDELYEIAKKLDIPDHIVIGMADTIMRDYVLSNIDPRIKMVPAITFDKNSMYCGFFTNGFIESTGMQGKIFFNPMDIIRRESH